MVASCWLFLQNLYYNARIHEHEVEEDAMVLITQVTNVIYIYGAPILDVSRSHTTTQHSR